MPVFSLIASHIEILFQSPSRLISCPKYLKVRLWQTVSAMYLYMLSVNSIIPSRLEYAWYSSINVNSGLCWASIPSFLNVLPISYTFSMPPTSNLLRFSSRAILKYISKFCALWCVINGLALAPVNNVVSTGVSTSVKSLLPKKVRIAERIWGLMNATFIDSSFMIKSKYLLLYLSSLSVKPWNFSGKGLKDFVKCSYVWASIDNSPLCVLITRPVIPTISPKSLCLKISYTSSPTIRLFTTTWIKPSLSFKCIKPSLPILRLDIILPATLTSVVKASNSSAVFSPNSLFTSLERCVLSNAWPNGSIPCVLKESIFWRLAICWSFNLISSAMFYSSSNIKSSSP